MYIGDMVCLPAIYQFGSDYIKDLVLPDAVNGNITTALAISEPWAGSDVAMIKTEAKLDNNNFVINGAKKYITNGRAAE